MTLYHVPLGYLCFVSVIDQLLFRSQLGVLTTFSATSMLVLPGPSSKVGLLPSVIMLLLSNLLRKNKIKSVFTKN